MPREKEIQNIFCDHKHHSKGYLGEDFFFPNGLLHIFFFQLFKKVVFIYFFSLLVHFISLLYFFIYFF